MASASPVLLVLFLATVAVGAAAGTPTAGPPAAGPSGPAGTWATDSPTRQQEAGGLLAATPVDPDRVVLEIQVHEDGDATWTVEYRVTLSDANASAAFESTRSEIAADPEQYRSRFAEGIGESVATARNRTGREMAIRDVRVETAREQVPEETGIVRYRFEWTGFAAQDGEELVAGDAIDRLFLNDRTLLEVVAPDGYGVEAVSPAADRREAGAVEWDGTRNFAEGEPRVRLAPADASNADDRESPAGGLPLPGALPVVAAFGGVAMIAGGGWLLRRSGTGDDPDRPWDEPLLSNEERVRRLVESRGGRVKQRTVTETLDWSDSKTSKVVDSLHERGDLDRYRLGRENVLALPDHDITETEDDDARD